ncbi:hypothetical protein [Devosia salina]|uniref:HEAT repeat domain-containing protein n=1 Tax=Devosia salina TaxID=2860336 RepID=A0ABX8WDJ1_9HYPH|nr:hypothetical protein [Devosia salina]QYO75669.1 hypothetical protein K1X15_13630 [Devosia salina]
MVIQERERSIARAMWGVAAGMVESRDPSVRDQARDALRDPSHQSIRALLAVGSGKDWLPSILDALAQIGIAAAEDVLSDHPTHEEMMAAARLLDRRNWSEVIAQMRGGMTIHDVNALSLGDDWWDVISGWVDEQRGLR